MIKSAGLPRVLGTWKAAGNADGDVTKGNGLYVVRILTRTPGCVPILPGIELLQFNVRSIVCISYV